MKLHRMFCAAALAAASCAALAGGTVTVTASGGSVTGANGSGNYQGLPGTAATAQIQYGAGPGSSNQFKFGTGQTGQPTGQSLGGSYTNGGQTTSTTGQSTVTNASGAPTYYSASWTSTSTNTNSGPIDGSGTYDPWTVTAGNLHDAGVYDNGGLHSLYYQASLDGGLFDLDPGQSGSYRFLAGQGGFTFLDLTIFNDRAPLFTFDTAPNYDVYLLDPNVVYGARQTVQDRLSHGTLLDTKAKGETEIQKFLDDNLQFTIDPNSGNKMYTGSLGGYSLTLAIVYHVQLPTYDPNNRDVVIAQWNTDTVNATPEPGTVAGLAVGALALLRRRKRS